MCVYNEHPLAGRDIQYRAPNSRSRHTTPFDEIKVICNNVNNPGIVMILVIKNVKAFCNQCKPCATIKIRLVHVSVKQDKLCTHV